jgi:quinol monooxygenase YgiN
MIVIVGYLKISPQKIADVRQAVRAIVSETRKEPGCIYYAFAEDFLEPGTIRIAERWESWEALKAHVAMPHFTAWRAVLKEIGVDEREVTAYEAGETRSL